LKGNVSKVAPDQCGAVSIDQVSDYAPELHGAA
jgi:hypothetical protein